MSKPIEVRSKHTSYGRMAIVLRLLARCRDGAPLDVKQAAADLGVSVRVVNGCLAAVAETRKQYAEVDDMLQAYGLVDPAPVPVALRHYRPTHNKRRTMAPIVGGKAKCIECNKPTTNQVKVGEYQVFLCLACRLKMQGEGLL